MKKFVINLLVIIIFISYTLIVQGQNFKFDYNLLSNQEKLTLSKAKLSGQFYSERIEFSLPVENLIVVNSFNAPAGNQTPLQQGQREGSFPDTPPNVF